jgi:hypothetical protein
VAPNELVPFHTRLEEAQIRQLKRALLFVKQPDPPLAVERKFSFKLLVNIDLVMQSRFRLARKHYPKRVRRNSSDQNVDEIVFITSEVQAAWMFTRAGRDDFAVFLESYKVVQ